MTSPEFCKGMLLHMDEEKRGDDSGVATGVNYGIASFLSLSKSICNPETGVIRGSRRILPPFKDENFNRSRQTNLHLSPLKHKPLGSHHCWLKMSSSPEYPQLPLAGLYW